MSRLPFADSHSLSRAKRPAVNYNDYDFADVSLTKNDRTEPDETQPDETQPDETQPDETQPDEALTGVLRAPDFRALFQFNPVASLVVLPDDPVFTIVAANDEYLRISGATQQDLLGRSVFEVFPDNPGDPSASGVEDLRASFRRTVLSRAPDQMASQRYDVAPAADGGFEERYWAVLNTPVFDSDGSIEYLLHSVRRLIHNLPKIQTAASPVSGGPTPAALLVDLTERWQSRRDAFLVRLDDATRPLIDPAEIMQTGARLLDEQLHFDRCLFVAFDPADQTLRVTTQYGRAGSPPLAGSLTLDALGPDCGLSLRAGRRFVEQDVERNPGAAAGLPFYRRHKIRSLVAVPVCKAGRLVSGLLICRETPFAWLPEQVELAELVAGRCWESIERARATRELQESEGRLRLAQRVARIGSFEWRFNENRLIWTSELEALFQLPEGAFEGSIEDWRERVLPEDAARVLAEIEGCIARRQSDCAYEFRAVLPGGDLLWLRGQAQFFYDESGAPVRMIGAHFDVDAQKRAEADLQHQWRTFDTALSHTPDFTYTFDRRGRFTYANQALLSLLQIPLADMIGQDFFGLGYPPELAARLERQIQEVVETSQTVRDQAPFTGPTGTTRHYEYIFVPVLGSNGEVEAVAGSTRDITDRSAAVQLVEDDRRRWRELLLQAPAAIAVFRGAEHRFEWVNADYVRTVGRSSTALIGKPVREALPEVVSQGYADMFDRVYRTGEAYVAHEAVIAFGEDAPRQICLDLVCLATRDSRGEVDGTFVHATDVTDLVRARQQIEESEARYRFLANAIPQMVWTATADGALDYVSARVAAFYDTSPQSLLGAGWLSGVHPDDQGRAVDRWRQSIETGEPYEIEFRILRAEDKTWRWFLVRALSMQATEGKVASWVGTCTDIHDQKESEAALRRANRELEEFSYVVSHDLQEPLRMVNIYTQLILRNLLAQPPALPIAPDDAIAQYAGFVRQGVTRMEALIRDLLTFSRAVHSEKTKPAPADLSASLSDALAVLESRIDEEAAVISAGPLPVVCGDVQQLAHVFQNLISNALKYRKPGVRPEIRVSAAASGRDWIVTVSDNGIGFEQRYADRIFGLFKRLHSQEYPGTGLGLAICKRIVERYEGRIWAEGKPGEGADFRFLLPGIEPRQVADAVS